MSVTGNAAQFGISASRKWWSDARELAVSFDRTALEDSIVAWIKLNKRDEVASTTPSIDFYYGLMSEAFLVLYDTGTINPEYAITDLGQSFINQIRRATGIGVQSLPTPAPVLSAADRLREEVIRDWRTLSTKQVRAKMARDKGYAAMFESLSKTDALGSGATTFMVIGA